MKNHLWCDVREAVVELATEMDSELTPEQIDDATWNLCVALGVDPEA